MTLEAHFISVTIRQPFSEVNEYLAAPQNFEQWAAGLGRGFRRDGADWVFNAGDGLARIRFTERNPYGVADHTVYPPDSGEVYVPLRAVPNQDGCEVTLTLFRQPGMTPQQFQADQDAVRRDLEKLKAILEA